MTCPAVVRVTTGTGPPGIGLPAGTADAGKYVRKAGATPYAYELVTPDQVALPQGLATTNSPTFVGLTLSGLTASRLAYVTTGGQIGTLSIGANLSIVDGALTSTSSGGTVTSVGLTVPTGLTVSGSPVTTSGNITISLAAGYSIPTTASQGNWDTAYSERLRWDGGSAGLNAATGRASLGLGGAAVLSVGTAAGTVAAGDDARFSTDLSYSASTRLLSSSTGADVTLPLATATDAGLLAAADKGKLDAIASGATANATDAQLRDRSTHTGTQSASTITGLATVATTGAYGDLSGRPTLGGAAALNVGSTAGTVAAGDDARFAQLQARLDGFRDAATFYASRRATASDSNTGTSEGEPFATIGAAVAAANAYVSANPGAKAKVHVGPGEFVEASLPFRLKPNILAQGALQRGTIIKPAAGQELNGFWALDSGCMICDFTFAGHQATGTSATDSSVGTRAWAVRFNELANGGQGVILTASPYVKDCASITAEDDAGAAGSTSTGDTGGGVEVDGGKCHPSSPIRSMVIYGFTQQNLGGPGAVIKNDAYAELVSFFGLFGTWHVQCETGGQATLSGGGCSEFGIYGLVADGYSTTALFSGSLRVAASSGATTVDVVSLGANRLGSSSRPAAGQVMLLGGGTYVITNSTPIDASGNVVADSAPTRAGYRANFYNPTGTGLTGNVSQGATADFRQRSQISAGCHSANYVGSGTNYSALPWNGGVPIRSNEAVERNYGRVFGLIVNDIGDVKIAGGAFAVDGTTGAVTINTSQFNLSGLNAIGPFSRNGGVSTVGVQLQEVSNAASLLASTGTSDGNTAPTQFAVRSYVDNRFLAGLTATAGQPLTVSDTSTQDGSGFWSRTRNVSLSLNTANGLAQLDGSGLIPSALLPSYVDDVIEAANFAALPGTGATGKIYVTLDNNKTYRWSGSAYVEVSPGPGSTDAVAEGSVNLYFSSARARQSISVSGSLAYDQATGVISYSAPTLATVATTGAYSDLTGRPTLGTAAATDASAYATAAQGAKADTAIQPGNTALSDAREWSAATIDQAEAEAGTATTRRAFTAQRVFQAIAAWWAGSAAKTKLDGIAAGATANSSDATLLNRANHTGTQAATTITGLAAVATTGAYADLSGKPTLGTAAALNTGTAAGNVVVLDGSGRLPAVDGSQLTGLTTGTVTSVGGTAPISSSGGNSPVISISAATTTAAGSMSAADKTKLDGIAAGATANATDAQLRDRSTHTGTQSAATITGLAAVATSGAYGDLSGRPTLGTAASLDVATTGDATSGQVVKGDDSRLTDARTPTAHTQAASTISDSTAAGRALLTAADAAAQRTSLGLGSLATQSGTFSGTSSGTNTGDQTITLTGDVTGSGTGSFAATLASTAVTAGSYGSASQVVTLTVDAKGRLTAAANASISVAATAISDSTAAGRALVTAADAAAQRTSLGAQKAITSGTAAPTGGSDGDIYLQYS